MIPETRSVTYNLEKNTALSEILFTLPFGKDGENKWIIKITKDGIKFNREEFTNWTPDRFATAFMDILENNVTVEFKINQSNRPIPEDA